MRLCPSLQLLWRQLLCLAPVLWGLWCCPSESLRAHPEHRYEKSKELLVLGWFSRVFCLVLPCFSCKEEKRFRDNGGIAPLDANLTGPVWLNILHTSCASQFGLADPNAATCQGRGSAAAGSGELRSRKVPNLSSLLLRNSEPCSGTWVAWRPTYVTSMSWRAEPVLTTPQLLLLRSLRSCGKKVMC